MTVAPANPIALIVLAAGEGTRMKSSTPKVLHGFAGRSLLGHVLAASADLKAERTLVVVGHGRDQLISHLATITPEATPVVQDVQRGTGHAVRLALESLDPSAVGTVVVLPGDTPLLSPSTLRSLVSDHQESGASATMLSSVVPDPSHYGRVLRASGSVVGVVEHKDATDAEREINEIAAGVYAFDHQALRDAIGRVSSNNAQGEEYLPDVISLLVADGRSVGAVISPAAETAGVNDRAQLAAAHREFNSRLLDEHMRAGVTVIDPATTWVDVTVRLERDVTLQPSVYLRGDSYIASGAEIGPDVTLVDTTVGADTVINRAVAKQSHIGAHCEIGPFAYLRPGVELADGVKVGTYVEVKKSRIGTGTKVPHLSYVGDATIGEHTNIGAATVFVNYDGVTKHETVVGSHARTGADNMFIAPVTIGDGAYTAAGSVIDQDVPPGALGIGRARQSNVQGWVARKRPGTAADEAAKRAQQRAESDEKGLK